MTWHPLNQSATGTSVAIVITQTYHWVYPRILCTDAMIATNQSISLGAYTNLATQVLGCIASCGNGSLGYIPPSIVPLCTNISIPLNITYSQRSDIVFLQAGDDFSVAFQSYGWRPLATAPSANWYISMRIIVATRSDNGLYNNAPMATLISPVNIPVNISTVINVPVMDVDGDLTRCRWSTNVTVNECGDVCPPDSLPSNTTIYPNCTIIITGYKIDDWYAVTIMIEDFINVSSTTPLSSIPVQFLVHIVSRTDASTDPSDIYFSTTTKTPDSNFIYWPLIHVIISLTLIGAMSWCCYLCWRCCWPFGVLVNNRKYQDTCEFYHIDRCLDLDCYWRKESNYYDVSSSTYINSNLCNVFNKNICRTLCDSFTNTTLRTNVDDYSVAQKKVKQNDEKYKRRGIKLNKWKIRSNEISKQKAHSSFPVINIRRKELKSKCQSSIIENTNHLNSIHEYARPLQVYQGKSLIKSVYVTHRRMKTSDYESSQIKTINSSSFDSIPNSLNAKNNKIIDK